MQRIILNDDLIRAKVVNIEFEGTTPEAFQEWLKAQGTLAEREFDITIYPSSFNTSERDTGFDGTVLHFYNPTKSVNEMYTIFRGSEHVEVSDWRPKDWVYNMLGIFVGQGISQYRSAQAFDEYLTEHIRRHTNIPLRKIAMGFSLGGNLAQTLQLVETRFDNVYTFNDAKPSVYQLAAIDKEFQNDIEEAFHKPLVPFSMIYGIPIYQLIKVASKRYDLKDGRVCKVSLTGDLLYAFHQVPGFLETGHEKLVQNVKDNSLRSVIESIPLSFFRELREVLFSYSIIYEKEGFDALWEEVTGIDAAVVEGLFRSIVDYREEGFHFGLIKTLLKVLKQGFGSFGEVYDRLPILSKLLIRLYNNAPNLIKLLMENGYVTHEEYIKWKENLHIIDEFIKVHASEASLDDMKVDIRLWGAILTVYQLNEKVIYSLIEDIEVGVESHDLDSLIYYLQTYDKIFL
ncbi:hypothetical protein N780_13175 [Pontibacillus chungwhensis BH030062]|uniref:DUF6792 domain-containing protein n=1 Tax=Pontibacillus chungwhensis BH030062 TaxID=1385513 RepID=A0A0A2UZ91_9BACI|nr:DUF6792 domain-containing protein [Pontibacillus chungwhensis]KGP93244.1 hypothetical protein N780_13175 [Pontibacillus chungwhensis BH030062]